MNAQTPSQFPERIMIANVSHPDGDKVILEMVDERIDHGDLPVAFYALDIGADQYSRAD
jgi:hypothetical protein